MERELEIKLKLNRDQANAASQAFVAGEKKRQQELLNDVQVAEKAKIDLIKRTNAEKVAAASKALKTEGDLAKESARVQSQAAKEAAEAKKKAEAEAAVAAKESARVQAEAAREAGAAAKMALREQTNATREAAREQALVAQRTSESQIEAARLAHKETAGSFSATSVAAGVSFGLITTAGRAAFSTLTKLAGDYTSSINEALAKQKMAAGGFSEKREGLGELANLMGKESDDKFTLAMSKYGEATGFKPEESRSFVTELYNAGAQYKGKNIDEKEFDQYSEQAGKLALAKHIRPDVMGDMAGTILGYTDYNKFGAGASEEALGHVNASMAIMGRGKGDNAVLARQFSMLSSASMNEDDMKGLFQSPEETASAISIAAEKHDAQAAELTKMAARGLRGGLDPKKKQFGLMQQAGVTAADTFRGSLEKLAPHVEEIVKQKRASGQAGFKVEDVLRENFEDEGAIDALNVFMNKGVTDGGFKDREAFGATQAGPRAGVAEIDRYSKSKRGIDRMADAGLFAAEDRRGVETADLQTVRKQAERGLRDRKEIDTVDTNFADKAFDAVTRGALGSGRDKRIDREAKRIIESRMSPEAKAAAEKRMTPGNSFAGLKFQTKDQEEADLITGINSIQEHKGNALEDAPGAKRHDELLEVNKQQLMVMQALTAIFSVPSNGYGGSDRGGPTPLPSPRPDKRNR